jgi:hypothetical protein
MCIESRGNTLLFWLMMILLLVPVWSFKYFPTTDGPNHVYNALCLRDYSQPDREAIRTFFARNRRLVPNEVGPALLTDFCRIFPPLIAEKLFLSLYLVGFMLSVRWMLSSIDSDGKAGGRALAVAGAPFAGNFYLHEGLYSFCFSLVLYFIVIGYWVRQERRPAVYKTILLAGLLMLLFLAHLVSLVLGAIFIALMLIVRLVRARREGSGAVNAVWRSVVRNTLAMLPAFLAALHFILTEHSTRFAVLARLHAHPWSYRLRNLVSWMKSFQPIELGPAMLQAALFGGITIWLLHRRKRNGRPNDVYLLLAGVYLLVFLLSPSALAGGSMIIIRLACFPFFALLMWFASEPLEDRQRRGRDVLVSGVSAIVLVALLVIHLRSDARIIPYLQEFANAEALVPRGATLLPIAYADGADVDQHGRRLSIGCSPLVEAAGYFAGQRGIVSLDNYEASVDYFPLIYRPGFDPYVRIVDRGYDFEDYCSPSGQRVEYVLLWTGGVRRDDPVARYIHRQLDAHYELIFTSRYSGYARLYRRR